MAFRSLTVKELFHFVPEGDHGRKVEWGDAGADSKGGSHGGEVHVLGDAGQGLAEEEVGERATLFDHLQSAHHVALRVGQSLALFQRYQSRHFFLKAHSKNFHPPDMMKFCFRAFKGLSCEIGRYKICHKNDM